MADPASGPTEGGGTVRYEETLDMRDDDGAGDLVGWVRIAIAFMVVVSLVSVVFVGFTMVQDFVGQLFGDSPGAVVAIALGPSSFSASAWPSSGCSSGTSTGPSTKWSTSASPTSV